MNRHTFLVPNLFRYQLNYTMSNIQSCSKIGVCTLHMRVFHHIVWRTVFHDERACDSRLDENECRATHVWVAHHLWFSFNVNAIGVFFFEYVDSNIRFCARIARAA